MLRFASGDPLLLPLFFFSLWLQKPLQMKLFNKELQDTLGINDD